MDLELNGKVAFIAGSTRGIGLAMARAFLREGARVVVTGRNQEGLQCARHSLSAPAGEGRALFVQGDMGVREQIETALKKTLDSFEAIHCVVANVGNGKAKAGWGLGTEDWQASLQENLLTSMSLASAALPHLVASRGNLILITSIAGREAIPAPLPYSAAKAALQSAVKSLARLVGKDGVRVNGVAPGNIFFPGGVWERKLGAQREQIEQYLQAEVPLGRFGAPEEIADVVVFLASERATFITGATIVADGGQTRSFF